MEERPCLLTYRCSWWTQKQDNWCCLEGGPMTYWLPSSSFSPHSYPANTWTVVHLVKRPSWPLDSRIPQRFSVVSVTARIACPSSLGVQMCPCFFSVVCCKLLFFPSRTFVGLEPVGTVVLGWVSLACSFRHEKTLLCF